VGAVALLALVLGGCGNGETTVAPPVAPADDSVADRWTAALGTFLDRGPAGGDWEIQRLGTRHMLRLAPHPTRLDMVVASLERPGGEAGREQLLSRWLVVKNYFFEAPSYLFFQNYRRHGQPETETLEDGREALRLGWAPKGPGAGLTGRRVWFDPDSEEILRIEDTSRSGRTVRSVRRIAETSDFHPTLPLQPDGVERCDIAPPPQGEGLRQDLERVAAQAPFAVYAPTALPAGFVPIRITYQECSLARAMVEPESAGRDASPVRLATLLYSDGLALISIAIAPPGDSQVLDRLDERMRSQEEAGACPSLPPQRAKFDEGKAVIRLREDACRVVLRREDLEGVLVTLTARNELALDEYVEVITSLEVVPKP
jgi:hypothetical protein